MDKDRMHLVKLKKVQKLHYIKKAFLVSLVD